MSIAEQIVLPLRTGSFITEFLEEPELVFGHGNRHIDQKTGLELFGPFTIGPRNDPMITQITVGLVAPRNLVPHARAWLGRIRNEITNDNEDPFTRPAFPGISPTTSVRCALVEGDTLTRVFKDTDLAAALKRDTLDGRIEAVTALYGGALEQLSQIEPKPTVVLLPISEDTWERCVREEDRIPAGARMERARRRREMQRDDQQLSLFGTENEEFTLVHDLRSALKREGMRVRIPVQLIRESTLRPDAFKRKLQDPATAAWNITTALHYKSLGHPWRMPATTAGTCYVGIAFFQDRADYSGMRASVAQIFSGDGEGLVMRGDPYDIVPGEWTPHLTAAGAENTLRQLLRLYEDQRLALPERVVIHKTSRFTADEENGFRAALGSIKKADFVAIAPPEQGTHRVLRYGEYPALRGTAVRLEDERWLLYTNGYVPYLRTYPGPHAPLPLEIQEMHGLTPEDTLLREILVLTKLNWNSAAFASALPITLLFAKRVGAILAELPAGEGLPEYRYYM
jgi:hypothetical protein